MLPPREKVMFTTSPATLQDLEDGSSTVQGSLEKLQDLGLDAGLRDKLQVFVPTGEVPEMQEAGYCRVNPMFESCAPPDVIFCNLHKAMSTQDIEFSCNVDWTVRDRLSQPFSVVLFED